MENNVNESSVQNEEQAGLKSEVIEVSNQMQNQQVILNSEVNSDLELSEESDEEKVASENEGENRDITFGKSKDELLALFKELLNSRAIASLRKDVEQIKVAFYKEHRAEVEHQKREFLAGGGDIKLFTPQISSQETTLKELFKEYREKRDIFLKEIETEKENNLKIKLEVIEALKELTNSSETLNNTFTTFRELQNRWKESGAVPKEAVKDLWETYHLHVENFYNFVKINKELRDLDLKKNYEAQALLCEEAEALLVEESIVSAFHKLQKLHESWREVGPVSVEYKEQLWNRFKGVSTQINKRHQDHFEAIKNEQLANLALKTELCEKCEAMVAANYSTKSEWENASVVLMDIQKVWKTIGFAPKKENTTIYSRFREACDSFFEKKRNYFLEVKNQMDNNLQAKIALCVAAEAISEREDWPKATEELLALQKEWKESGHISRKQSDEIWKRFRAACDLFFERKSTHYGKLDTKHEDNLKAKQTLLQEIKDFDITQEGDTFAALKEFQRRWIEIGFVPMKAKESLNKEYKAVIDGKFNALRGSDKERKMVKFKDKVNTIKGNNSRIKGEKERLLSKIKEIEGDIQLWENNIGFFSKSKNAQSLINDVNLKISKAKSEIAFLHEKIAVIDNQEN